MPIQSPRPWFQMHSGDAIDLLAPEPSDINFDDIALQLSRIVRFCGAGTLPITVEDHSILVKEGVEAAGFDAETQLYALLHDVHETVLGEIPAPTKHALRGLGAGDALASLERALDAAIFVAAGLAPIMPPQIAEAVRNADIRTLQTEKRDLQAKSSLSWATDDYPPYPIPDISGRILDRNKPRFLQVYSALQEKLKREKSFRAGVADPGPAL